MALNFTGEPQQDNKITKCQYQAFYPSETSLMPGQDIHIVVQNPEILVLPNQAYFQLKYKAIPEKDKPLSNDLQIYNNGPPEFFSEFRYNLNGIEIDRCKQPGIATAMKALPSWNYDKKTNFLSIPKDYGSTNKFLSNSKGYASCVLSLSYVFGFAEDNKMEYLMLDMK